MNDPEDGELVRKARNGDVIAFETLVNRHYERMYAIAFKWTRNRHDAEDITQNACIKLGRGIRSLHNETLFSTWLYRIVINAAKDFQRQAGRLKTGENFNDTESHNPTPEKQLYSRELLDVVYSLPQKEKDAILLVFGEGLSHGAAAQILECAETTVSWRIYRARERISSRIRQGQ